jgi:hypothetical protein
MEYHESSGNSLKESREQKKRAELHHLRIPVANRKKEFLVEHHSTAEGDQWPEIHVFEDGHEMLAHVANHTGVPEPEGE